ncbi:MAG: ferrochelatase [Gammaproteobacteria bacterium]|nr:MAG: ferrochelatase [Gammaproteobacteria bacterium]
MTTGLIVANLGTPAAPTPDAVKPYLEEFLSDPNVVAIPKLIWWPILHGIILRKRPAKSAEAYAKIWMEEGSPLLVHSQRIQEKLALSLEKHESTSGWKTVLGMTYGKPSIKDALKVLSDCKRIIVLPLYPQYSSASTASVEWKIKQALKDHPVKASIQVIHHYYDHPAYIRAIADSVHDYWREHGRPDRFLLSYHGMPERTRRAGDPYFYQCEHTSELLSRELELESGCWEMAFQSRFGAERWLQPYTQDVLQKWARGHLSVGVLCPGFAADCLETLEEINMQYRDFFKAEGGKRFDYIPALNDSDRHIDCLTQVVMSYLKAS